MNDETYLSQVTREYAEKTPKSGALFSDALTLLPGGIGGSAPTFDPHPLFVRNAEGSRIWDVDGNEYIDFNLCWGVLFVGHKHPKIIAGLRSRLEDGTMYGLPHEEIVEAARALAKRFPIDKVRFVNSGSEATLYAIRLARRYTRKDKIIKIEGAYHGVSDSLHISKRPAVGLAGPPMRPTPAPHGLGITAGTAKDTLVAPFNDIDAIKRFLDEHLGEVAAVIVEPMMMNAGVIPPDEGYLKSLRELTEEYNVLLIFDEVKTGVKLAAGGACEYFDVKPDIVTLAKAIGGGMPIGACGGREEVMMGIDPEGLFGTYSANPMSIRSCKITLTEVLTDSEYSKVKKLGENLLSGYRDIISDTKLNAIVQGVNAVGGILFTTKPVRNYRDWARADKAKIHEYFLGMLNHGIIPMAYGPEEEWLVSVQHTDEDIEAHLEAFKEVAPHLR
ncbi:MAG: aspartate aminotransferase family protein [Candidatus Thorarchaeota archaeon]